MEIVKKRCLNCDSLFFPRKVEVMRGWGKYCSHRCSVRHAPKPKRTKLGWRKNSRIKRNQNKRLKDKAREWVYRAIKSGKIDRPNHCWVCWKPCKPDAHHENHRHPDWIVWLCRKCHLLIHRHNETLLDLNKTMGDRR